MLVLLWVFTASAATPVAAASQAPRARIAVLQSDDLGPYVAPTEPFADAVGEDVAVTNLHGRESEAKAWVDKWKPNPPAIVFALGAKAAWTVRHELPGVPVVYAQVQDPDRYGISGVSGISMTASPDAALSQFISFFPGTKTVGVLAGPDLPPERLAGMQSAADAAGVELLVQRAERPRDVRPRFHRMSTKVDAVWVPQSRDILTQSTYRELVEECHRTRMPMLVESENMVRAGGLFALVPDPVGVGHQAAALVRATLDQGAGPTTEDPQQLRVALNLRVLHAADLPFDYLMMDFVDFKIE